MLVKDEKIEIIKETFPGEPEQMFDYMVNFNELMMKYNSAIREIKTKLEILNDELSLGDNNNPIESIQSRIKKPISIANKLKKMGKPMNLDTIVENLNDIAGIRVICSFIDDIYKISDMIAKQDDIVVIEIRDYIKNPKPNGYRSYHMIVEVPVFFSDSKQFMRVEIQIRTVAMDFWASLEHRLKYKSNVTNEEEIIDELKNCADIIANTDMKMLEIKKKINAFD
jgi:putative GTP pyrophosphokinase